MPKVPRRMFAELTPMTDPPSLDPHPRLPSPHSWVCWNALIKGNNPSRHSGGPSCHHDTKNSSGDRYAPYPAPSNSLFQGGGAEMQSSAQNCLVGSDVEKEEFPTYFTPQLNLQRQ